ncbi:FeoB-associated Cys-rich membrane protein [Pseudodesulfovibrio indicus]|uniref:FeoB-associated Cys-rich membrane protein n=1 Tax=Pseudodesulfovibrio indicus TaxID=1716143 RepID=UPI00292EFD0B|nr:FeoB-associated Cys-rich membrane protein [Pseudodesulfovibrio indicus]
MDTLIAVIIIALAVAWVGRKLYKQLTAKGGCGCSTDCASGCSSHGSTGRAEDSGCSCGDSCTCDKET